MTQVKPFEAPGYVARCDALSRVIIGHMWDRETQRVVDLGCGAGLIGKELVNEGHRVTFVDGRREHVGHLLDEGYSAFTTGDPPSWKSLSYDVVVCCGLLYHVEDPRQVLKDCSGLAPELFLETLCLDNDLPMMLTMTESTERHDQSIDGWANRCSPSKVERDLRLAGYQQVVDLSSKVETIPPDGVHDGFLYRWEVENTGGAYRDGYGLRKLWWASTKERLA